MTTDVQSTNERPYKRWRNPNVRQLIGETTTFEVKSKKVPNRWYHICIKAWNGNGECSCKWWRTVGWKSIRDHGNLPAELRCTHLRDAREEYTQMKIDEEPAYE